MKEYAVVFEQGQANEENWGAYVPDLPGCTTTGDTFEEAERNIKEAIEAYVTSLRESGEAIPQPTTEVRRVAVAA